MIILKNTNKINNTCNSGAAVGLSVFIVMRRRRKQKKEAAGEEKGEKDLSGK